MINVCYYFLYMQISKTTYFVTVSIVTVGIVAVVGAGFFFLLHLSPSVSDETRFAQINRLNASARVYYGRVAFYTGVCSDIGVVEPYRCTESEESYALEVPLINGGYYCADSTGFLDRVQESVGDKTEC